MGAKHSLAEIANLLLSAKRIVVISHYNPDPDAYGSSCGLSLALRFLGKTVTTVNESGILAGLNWIPGVQKIESTLPSGQWDALIACDCGDAGRVGDSLKARLSEFPVVVNLDHHASNDFFGTYNFVAVEASSTSEIVADLLNELKVKWTAEIATCLYAGVSADTGSFKYTSTSAKTFRVAEALVNYGASPAKIAQELYARNSLASMKLQAEALTSMRLLQAGKIAAVVVTADMYSRHNATKEDADSLVEIARDIDGVLVSVLIREYEDIWRISLRSKGTAVDVSAIATEFGGGGHKAAAAFRWRKSLAELEARLFPRISEAVEKL